MNEFGRRSYVVQEEGKDIASAKARVTIEIDGKVHTRVELRAPGMIAIIVSPETPDRFAIEMVEQGGRRFTDLRLPPEAGEPLDWQITALGLRK